MSNSKQQSVYPTPKRGPLASNHASYGRDKVYSGPKDYDLWVRIVVGGIVAFFVLLLLILFFLVGKPTL
jgi:hypothetical protein